MWVPSWTLPARGHVQGLVTENDGAVVVLRDEQVDRALLSGLVGCSWMLCGRRILGGVKRVRLHRKTPAHLAGYGRDGGFQSLPKVWKRLRVAEGPRFRHNGAKVRGCIRVMRYMVLWTGLGLGREFGDARAHVSKFCLNRDRNLCSLSSMRILLWINTRIRHLPTSTTTFLLEPAIVSWCRG